MGGENKYGKSGHWSIFTFLEALNDAFLSAFSSSGHFHFLHLIKDTDSIYGHVALKKKKWKHC